MGATLEDVTLDNVLFENCKLDYSALIRVRAAGPVIFSTCSLRETTFSAADLGAALIDECDLRLTEFDGGKHGGLDLRGNGLSRIRGLASFKQIIVDRAQAPQLAEALTAELDVTFGEDLDNKQPRTCREETHTRPVRHHTGKADRRRARLRRRCPQPW
jgi:uncharacterized protein YjbI with pentapeptide repeats